MLILDFYVISVLAPMKWGIDGKADKHFISVMHGVSAAQDEAGDNQAKEI